MLWLLLVLIAAFFGATNDIIIKKTLTICNLSPMDLTLFQMVFMGIYSFIFLIIKYNYKLLKLTKSVPKKAYFNIKIVALFYITLYTLYAYSLKIVTNPGYTRLGYSLNIIFTFLLACIFFNQKINIKKIAGIFITLFGFSMVIL